MKKFMIILLIAYLGYSCSSTSRMQKSGNYMTAIDNAITDYLKTKFSRNSDIFSVVISHMDNNTMEICFFPEKVVIGLLPSDTIGGSKYPIRYIEKGEKLFYWYEEGYHLTAEAISVLARYGAIIWPVQYYNWLLDHDCFQRFDFPAKGPIYYICKNNYNKYVKRIINLEIAQTRPKFRCK